MDSTPAPALGRSTPAPAGGRVQLALDVDDLEQSVAFYSTLFGTPPSKRRPGYANFALASPPLKLVLQERPGHGGRLDHLGIEVPDSATVQAEARRLHDEGLLTLEQSGTTCCFATQDKVWVAGPDGERWEVYTVLADSPSCDAGRAEDAAPAAGTALAGTCC